MQGEEEDRSSSVFSDSVFGLVKAAGLFVVFGLIAASKKFWLSSLLQIIHNKELLYFFRYENSWRKIW